MKQHEQNTEADTEPLQIRQLDDLGWQILQLVAAHLCTRSSDSTTHDTPSTNPEHRQLAQTADPLRQRRQLVATQLRNSSVKATTWLCVTHIQLGQICQQLDLARQARELVAAQLQSTVNRGEKRTHAATYPQQLQIGQQPDLGRHARQLAIQLRSANESIRPKKMTATATHVDGAIATKVLAINLGKCYRDLTKTQPDATHLQLLNIAANNRRLFALGRRHVQHQLIRRHLALEQRRHGKSTFVVG